MKLTPGFIGLALIVSIAAPGGAVTPKAGPVKTTAKAAASAEPAKPVAKPVAASPKTPAEPVPTNPNLAPIVVLSIEGIIDPVMVKYVGRGYEVAKERHAQCVLLKISTPGGLEGSMREIVQATLNSPVPTIAYVTPRGTRAASAGAFILLACHLTAMSPGTTMGAAHPVGGKGEDIGGTLNTKITNDTSAFIRSLAKQRGRSETLAEDLVRKSLSFNETEALKRKLVDAVAEDDAQLFADFDGRTVVVEGRKIVLHLVGAPVVDVGMGLREKFFHILANPELAYILLTLGTLGLIFELQNPHGITGILGAVFLIMALISLSILPFSVGGLLLMALGVGLFVAELKLQTHGGLAIAGAICLLLGSLMLFGPVEPFWHVSHALIYAMVILISSVFVLLIGLGLGALRRPASVGRESMIGAKGVALTELAPGGQVHLQGEDWTAVLAEGAAPIRRGDKVIVKSVQGLTLEVEPAAGAPKAPGA